MPRPRARLDPAAITSAFAPDGLHGTTSERLARQAGVAKPTMYAHGRSKEAMFLACVDAETERLLSRMTESDLRARALAPRARIAALAQAIIDHGRVNPDAARLLHQTARHRSSTVAAEVDAALARPPARLASILRRDTTASCADRIAPALFGAAATLATAAPTAADSEYDATLLGDAFAAVLDPISEDHTDDRAQDIDLY
jgi:AcrR family transcriptional regulator